MRRRALVLLSSAALLVLADTSVWAAGRDEKIVNATPDRTWSRAVGGAFASGKSIAVVVAISSYIGERSGGYRTLQTAKDDANKMVRFLKEDAGFDIIYVLTDDNATKQRIDRLMIDEIPAVVGTRDRFLFYWSGHGDQRFSAGRQHGFLPLADSKVREFSTMISMDDIWRWDNYLASQHALFVLDACLSGLAGFERKAPEDARLEQLSQPAHQLMTAGTDKEQVISGERWTGSLFTDSFILGAKGAAPRSFGIVSLFSLIEFIQGRVANEKERAHWSRGLTPQVRNLRDGNGTFFFTPPVDVTEPKVDFGPQLQPDVKGPSPPEAPPPPAASLRPAEPPKAPQIPSPYVGRPAEAPNGPSPLGAMPTKPDERLNTSRVPARAVKRPKERASAPTLPPPQPARTGNCNTMQKQCAVQTGGTCDPDTGTWRYFNSMTYDDCISRALARQR